MAYSVNLNAILHSNTVAYPWNLLLSRRNLAYSANETHSPQTCKILHRVSYDRSLWVVLYNVLAQDRRCPLPGNGGEEILAGLTQTEVESLVVGLYATEKQWLFSRAPPKLLELAAGARPLISSSETWGILAMDVLLDRWLVVMYQDDILEIWDLFPGVKRSTAGIAEAWNCHTSPMPICKIRHVVQGIGPCTAFANCVEQNGPSLVLAVARCASVN